MEKFEVTILGCGSAKPSTRHFPSAQIINFRDKLFLVDCGEGTQMQICRNHVRFTRMNNIFISHLHGDHCFGLIGLLSSLELLGRTAEMHIYAPGQLEKILFNDIAFFNRGMSYKITFHPVDTERTNCFTKTIRYRSIRYRSTTVYLAVVSFLSRSLCCRTYAGI